jgi:hypothetical protein
MSMCLNLLGKIKDSTHKLTLPKKFKFRPIFQDINAAKNSDRTEARACSLNMTESIRLGLEARTWLGFENIGFDITVMLFWF